MSEVKITKEIAENDFLRFAKFARVKLDRAVNKIDIDSARQHFVEEIMDGRIMIDDEGRPTILTEHPDYPQISIVKRPSAVIMKAMDQQKKDDDVAKVAAMCAAAVGVPKEKLFALDYPDFKNVQEVVTFFLIG